ncbi:natriuretic peptides B [Ailuropoda melanoleuca]|uniref:Natriuretic peptides B n=1 Tax=Ailuropoda melanoleuca TaxID=9646 RepID=A0A7N5JXD8_AILME|nr:natriuretic peptides B [Ailuropoda melanoleuca]
MDPQTALPRALLLLLFLHLSPLGGRSHPLGSPNPGLELSAMQELLDHLRDIVSELQAEQLSLGSLQQDHSPKEAWETRKKPPAGALAPSDNALQALRRRHSPKMMLRSGCFGRSLDRIGSLSGLGCNVLRRY